MVVASSEQLVDRIDGTFGASVATRHGEQSIHEAVLRMSSLEARCRPKVIGGRIDTLAAPECCDDFRRPVPESERGHVDERTVVRFERDAQIELEHAVRSQKRPISAAGNDPTAQPRTFEATARDRYRRARSVRHGADLLRALYDHLKCHEQTRVHREWRPRGGQSGLMRPPAPWRRSSRGLPT